MNSDNSNKLNQLIKELDTFLYQGYLLKTHVIDDWNVKSKQEENKPDIEQYKKDFENQINEWLNRVALLLFSNFDEKHLYFHFVHPKPGLSFSFSHPLGNLTHALGNHLFTLEDIILGLEERRNLSVRQEIAEKEYEADTLYRVTYSEHTRELKLNNITLAHPNSDSKAVNFFEYVFQQPNTEVEVSKIEENTGQDLSDNIHDILRDLGFTGSVRQIFFPIATKKKVMFTNPITKQYAIKNDLPTIDFSKLARQSEKKREETS